MIDLPPLPFFALPDRLPAPLPSKEAIAAATDVVKESTGRRIVRIGPFLIKYGGNVTLNEGENMLFVSQFSSSISIPKVYAVYSEIGSIINYIVMENLEGRTLESCWTELDTDAKSTIAEKLRDMIDRLRGLPCPGYYGSIGHRALEDSMFWTAESIPAINGPFETEVELFEALVQKYFYNTSVPQKAEFYRRTLPRVLQLALTRRATASTSTSMLQVPAFQNFMHWISDGLYDLCIVYMPQFERVRKVLSACCERD